jgi:hypothetical protein
MENLQEDGGFCVLVLELPFRRGDGLKARGANRGSEKGCERVCRSLVSDTWSTGSNILSVSQLSNIRTEAEKVKGIQDMEYRMNQRWGEGIGYSNFRV